MIGTLSSREVSQFVLETHADLRGKMMAAMNDPNTDNAVIPKMFNRAFSCNPFIQEVFSSWARSCDVIIPGWRDYMRFMNFLVEMQHIEIYKADRLVKALTK